MKICVITPRFAISGVSLAQQRFARALAEAGHEVDLIIGRIDADLAEPHLPDVNVVALQRENVRSMLFPFCRYLKASKPDVVFSAEDHLNAIVLLATILTGSNAKVSGSSRVTPFDTYSSRPFSKKWILKQIVRAVSWRANALTCVSKDMVEQYRQIFPRARHVPVYNIVDDPASRRKMAEPVDDDWFLHRHTPLVVAAGMLEPWKGFGDLVRAIGELANRGRSVRLVILGEGSMRDELEGLVLELGLTDRIRLPGRTDNPLKYFARAEVFALSSYVEGLPNVLVEAMMCGCTPVATDCPTGPREVLQGGKYGYLVPVRDPVGLADGIEKALDNPIPATELATAIQPFAAASVMQRHFELLELSSIETTTEARP
jgi:glycosyltransferase involved in cell wall biosynthesis